MKRFETFEEACAAIEQAEIEDRMLVMLSQITYILIADMRPDATDHVMNLLYVELCLLIH